LRIRSGNQATVRAWATLAPDHRIRVLLINDSRANAAQALVRVPATGAGSVERLSAASAYATGGVTLGGQSFGTRTGTGLLASPRAEGVVPHSGVYGVRLPAASAALVTVASRGR
jgi:hypothetical protein